MWSTPFMRYMSPPLSSSSCEIQLCSSARSSAPCCTVRMCRAAPWSMLTLVTLASCFVSPSLASSRVGLALSARCRSKPLIPSTDPTDTSEWAHLWIGAKPLMPRSRASMRSSSSASETRSVLFSSSRSAKATCATASLTTPSGFTASRCRSICFASTRVTIPSRRAKPRIFACARNVCATGAGSAMPVVSMTIPSKCSFPDRTRWRSLLRIAMRSCRTVQQMQPFRTSTISSSDLNCEFFWRSLSSMEMSPNSFSMTAIFLPWVAVRMWLSSVVLPLPRKPVNIVTGTRERSSDMPQSDIGDSLYSICTAGTL
mmetsp:Transcript_37198/g.120417  ORF Transcript_37198/g.120417 Transcript_37198/m.120417 type:complete len:314 (+) Transcript_37198:647-1588(+)